MREVAPRKEREKTKGGKVMQATTNNIENTLQSIDGTLKRIETHLKNSNDKKVVISPSIKGTLTNGNCNDILREYIEKPGKQKKKYEAPEIEEYDISMIKADTH